MTATGSPLLFHATPRRHLATILTEGLKPSCSRSASLAVYLTDDLYTAQNYAGMHPDEPIEVLGIDRRTLLPAHLQADDHELVDLLNDLPDDDPLYREDGWNRRDALDLDAEQSLRICHQVGYTRPILPWALRRQNPVTGDWERCSPITEAARADWFRAVQESTPADHQKLQGWAAQGFDVQCVDAQGLTGVHRAARDANPGMVTALLTLDVNPASPTSNGWNALHEAAGVTAWSHLADAILIMDQMLAHGLEVDATVQETAWPGVARGATALWIAAYNGRASLVKHLMARGARPNPMNMDGVDVLTTAHEQGFDEVVMLVRDQLRREEEQALLRVVLDQNVPPLSRPERHRL